MKIPKSIFLIDGNSLAYRAFYALPDTMKTTTGITTNAIYGFTTMLIKILDENPEFVAISFDRPEPTFRHKEYKEYKATRQKAPPTLHEQIPYVKEIAAAFDIPIYEIAGYEADDVIGTLAKEAEKQGHHVVILSGDLDPLQLVNENIKVMTTRKGITDTMLYGIEEVKERYNLKPEQLIDFKALKGDTSDNIPGVPKIGEKTAVQLLKEFGSLDNLLENVDRITRKSVKDNIKNNVELAHLSKRLGTIVTNVPIDIDFDKCKREEINWQKIIPLFEKFEFERLIKKYGQNLKEYQTEAVVEKKRVELAKFDFKCVQTAGELEALIKTLAKAEVVAFDLETTGLDVFTAEIVGISFATETEAAFYFPISSKVPEQLKSMFSSNKLKIGHNIKYDIEVLNNNGIEVKGPLFDTMVAAYLLDPVSGKLALKSLARQFLGRDMIKLAELIGQDAEYKNFADVPIAIARDYACSDAEATFGLYEIFRLALKGQKLDKLFYEIEMPLIPVLIEMETNGVSINKKLLANMSKDIEKELKELETHIFAISGEGFNINSPKQLAKILFEKLKLPISKRTKTGASTNIEVLEELAAQKFEIAERLMAYRQLTKLKSTYVDVLPTLVHPKTGRIHTSFNQTITATGRLSSSDPNLQNIPKRIRSAFIPEKKDWVILAADYSQIELRILAHMSQDPLLIKAFNRDKDIHQATADELGITRDAAKAVNFGIIYGISDFGLAKQLKIKRTEAQGFIDKYFAKHAGVKAFMDKTIKAAGENGYVTTMLGRKRPLPDINSPNYGIKSFTERTAINTPVQGTAADMIKIAMVRLNLKLKTKNVKLILQVHDELVFECPRAEAAQIKKIIEEEMVKALPLVVPIKVDISVGESWRKLNVT